MPEGASLGRPGDAPAARTPAPAAEAPVVPTPGRAATGTRHWLSRGLRALGRFLWDFLVGDTPELLVGVVVVVGAVAALAASAAPNTVAVVAFPLLVVLVLSWSVRRAWRAH